MQNTKAIQLVLSTRPAVRFIQTKHAAGWGSCMGCDGVYPAGELTKFRACTRCAVLEHMKRKKAAAAFDRAARALGKR